MEFVVEFYTDENGKKPVQGFLDEVFKKNRSLWARTISGLQKIKNRAYHKEPLSKALGDNLWEIRIRSGRNILRIIYTFAKGRRIILLHGFIKKTQKIPKRELDTARQRLKQLRFVLVPLNRAVKPKISPLFLTVKSAIVATTRFHRIN